MVLQVRRGGTHETPNERKSLQGNTSFLLGHGTLDHQLDDVAPDVPGAATAGVEAGAVQGVQAPRSPTVSRQSEIWNVGSWGPGVSPC